MESRIRNVETQNTMLHLSGEIVTTYGSFIPKIQQTLVRSDFVAVAVSAIIFT